MLLRKTRSYAEVYNDLDGEIVNVFRCARDHGEELKEALRLTPFAREEFAAALEPSENTVERARRVIIRSFMGFGSQGVLMKSTGFRANSNKSGNTPAHDWKNYVDAFEMLVDRLRQVVIEHRDAREVMAGHDSGETLHYVDPPYVHSTRSTLNNYCKKHLYRHEMTDDQHRDLAAFLERLKGYVIVSGYPSPLYDEIFRDWIRVETKALADGARERTEVLWLSANAVPHGFSPDTPFSQFQGAQ